jgi:hypothetical protein
MGYSATENLPSKESVFQRQELLKLLLSANLILSNALMNMGLPSVSQQITTKNICLKQR